VDGEEGFRSVSFLSVIFLNKNQEEQNAIYAWHCPG
jgi:hypothetical protein